MKKKDATNTSTFDGKTQIILAAETMFAKYGIDGVSLRQVAARAGQGNHHAVQYHFTSRDGLVQSIFDYRMQQMEPRREEMLAKAMEIGTLNDERTIIEIIFLPQITVINGVESYSYANFLCQYLLRNSKTGFNKFFGDSTPNLNYVLKLLNQRLSYLPERVAQRRLITACFMFINALSAHVDDLASGQADESFESALDDTIKQIVLATFMPFP